MTNITESDSLRGFDEVIVWDNSVRENLLVYGRFAAALEGTHDIVYTQDDDALCPAPALVAAYDGTMLVNVPSEETPLTAWGAVFHKDTIRQAFDQYLARFPDDDFFRLNCDLIHAWFTPWQRLDLGHVDFAWFNGPDRMHTQPGYYEMRAATERRCSMIAPTATEYPMYSLYA